MIKSIVTCLSAIAAFSAHATLIEYVATNLGGTTWEYEYTITNDTLGVEIEEFTIYFDYTLFDNLAIGSTPAGWDPLVLQRDLGIPDDGIYDALALDFGIASGATLGGFSVTFDFLGAGAPGAQLFEIIDAFTFATLDTGMTTQAAGPQPIPEPGMLLLIGAGVLAGFAVRRRRVRAMFSIAAAGVSLMALTLAYAPSAIAADSLLIDDMQLVDRTRVSRTVYDYRYRLVVTNTAPVDLTDVTVYIGQTASPPPAIDAPQELSLLRRVLHSFTPGPGTQITEDVVDLGIVPAGATVTSTDTFTIRQDRRFQLDPDALVTETGYTASVLLRGVVTDLPIEFAEVEVVIDRSESGRPIIESGRPIIERYTTTADEDGNYEVAVDFVSDPDFVSITADGVEQQSFVQLNSIAGSAGGMLEEATPANVGGATRSGPGVIVDGSNFNPLKVTHVSTALAALATDANNGQAFTNDAALAAAQSQVNNDVLILVAAAIKTVIDNPQVSLPNGVLNTAALLENAAVFDSFVVLLQQNFPEQFQAAIDATVDFFSVGYVASQVPQTLYTALVRADPLRSGAQVFTFEQTGVAQVIALDGETTDASWSVDVDGNIEVILNNSPITEYFPFREVPPGSGNSVQVRALQRTTNLELIRIAIGVQSDQILVGSTELITFPDNAGVLPDEIVTNAPTPEFGYLAFGSDGILPYTQADLAGRTFAQAYYHTDNSSLPPPSFFGQAADLLTFNSGGTGSTARRGYSFTWLIDGDGLLRITFANGDTTTNVRYGRIDGNSVDRGVLIGRWDDNQASASDFNAVAAPTPLQFNEAQLVDMKYRSSISIVDENALYSFEFGRFDFNFFAEGAGCRDSFGFLSDFSWSINPQGYMIANRFYQGDGGLEPLDQRSWLPVTIVPGVSGPRYWVLENLELNYGDETFPADPTLTPGRINFYEVVQDLTGNQAPTPVDDSYSLTNSNTIFLDVLANDTDPDGDIIVLRNFTYPTNGGTVNWSYDETGAANGILYTPPTSGYADTDTFDYYIADTTCNAGLGIGTVTITLPSPPE